MLCIGEERPAQKKMPRASRGKQTSIPQTMQSRQGRDPFDLACVQFTIFEKSCKPKFLSQV